VEERRHILNDRVLVNCSAALGFLVAYGPDPSQVKDLFAAYDGTDARVSLGVKLGVLMNGSDKVPAGLAEDAAKHLAQLLQTASGVEEIDGKDIKAGRPDEEIFRFDGSLDALGHVMNTYQRRLSPAGSPSSKLVFKAITDSGLLNKLNEEEDFSAMSEVYRQIPSFIALLPIPPLGSK
jgi:hypothetical protein